MKRLLNYFTDGITSQTLRSVGAEIETQFVDISTGQAISTDTSQKMLLYLAQNGWQIGCRKGNLITTLIDQDGNQINYELGRHNLEISTAPSTAIHIVPLMHRCLIPLYQTAKKLNAQPYLHPILTGNENLLVIPDERDAVWLELDGQEALAPLARTSSVQFTISVAPEDAVSILNRLSTNIDAFLADYPQDVVWKQYIKDSHAGYLPTRYGGPLFFTSLGDYCNALSRHSVVQETKLVPFQTVTALDIPLFLRSIWWYFRLKRFGNNLCIEIRPLPRRSDDLFQNQLEQVLSLISV